MKKIVLYSVLLWLISCNSEQNSDETTTNKAAVASSITMSDSREEGVQSAVANNSRIITRMLRDISSIERETGERPIADFSAAAKAQADQVIHLNKNNVTSVFEQAASYKHCFIVTEDHTIAKITSFVNCQTSGSWGACMPMAVGYIKKGEFQSQEGYVNNIIGRPDNQSRMVFLFK